MHQTPRHPWTPRASWLRACLLALALTLAAPTLGCQEGIRDETEIFEEAETLYRTGDYDGARELYMTFLNAYPRSPLANTAQLRLRTLDREFDSVMTSRGGNRPVYIRPDGAPPTGHEGQPSMDTAPLATPPEPAP